LKLPFLLMERFHPPGSFYHRRALGLPRDLLSGGSSVGILRVERLSSGSAGLLNKAVREIGGVSLDFPSDRPRASLLLLLPPARWGRLLTRLRHQPTLVEFLRNLELALEASRGALRPLRLPGRFLPLTGKTLIQGILNVTPDSFFDGGSWKTPRAAVGRALQMVEEGADIVDVGGESTRPGARPVGAREEIRRILPVVESLAGRISIPISVDTTKAEVARAALGAGAEIINDISGLKFEPRLAEVAARHGAALILSHIRGRPRTMQKNPRYHHLVCQVVTGLQESVHLAESAGVRRDSILVDPGIGFGKTGEQNLLLLRYLAALHSAGCPILVGASRKSFLRRLQGEDSQGLLHGSLAVAACAVARGAAVLRVHDVRATVAAVRVAEALRDAPLKLPVGR
jgi:dihydropteroate synthase